MSRALCRYLIAPREAYAGATQDSMVRVGAPERSLCGWAFFHPASAEKLTDTPPWLQRNATAGHLLARSDCATCSCHEAGEPVE